MPWFDTDFLNFLAELQLHNEREWFQANKARFKEKVEAPFKAFVQEMIDRLAARDARFAITPQEAIFRIYRDTRFSKNKQPYKTHMSAVIAPGGRKGHLAEGMYLEFSADHVRLYGGIYRPDTQTLYRLRKYLVAHLDEFGRLLDDPAFRQRFDTIRGERNKRLPREFMAAAERQPLLYNKSFYYFHNFDPEVALRDDLVELLLEYYEAGRPMGEFLATAAGFRQMPD